MLWYLCAQKRRSSSWVEVGMKEGVDFALGLLPLLDSDFHDIRIEEPLVPSRVIPQSFQLDPLRLEQGVRDKSWRP